MATKALPCPTRARLFVKYNPETGDMIWNARARCFFETDHEFKRWNSRYAGTPALMQTNNEGYRTGCIAKARIKAHQLAVALAVGVWPNGDVDHIDGDKANNAAANLRWDTRAGNHNDKNAHGTATVGERHPMHKLCDQEVLAMRARRAAGATTSQLAEEFNVSRMTAHRAATGRSWSHL